jgi:hypothetical protein
MLTLPAIVIKGLNIALPIYVPVKRHNRESPPQQFLTSKQFRIIIGNSATVATLSHGAEKRLTRLLPTQFHQLYKINVDLWQLV